ncbi:MAG: septum formation protein Maf [Saprospiraceae bacterium]|nr:septum formation protein Maf [Saprospiraceae bacterium]
MTTLPVFQKKIVLGSKSPRRSQLLREAGFSFEIRTADTDESYGPDIATEQVAVYLAEKKAADLLHTLEEDEILITADSVVILEGKILGKPVDQDEAFLFIRALAGKSHQVITGVCISTLKTKKLFQDKTEVIFGEMTDEEIRYYIHHYNPLDKAGAYGIQDWIGLCKVHTIHGSYANVMGLPVHRLYEALAEL